jgi:polysaccharide deacetylase family protein (PEP-CTERM system associated)
VKATFFVLGWLAERYPDLVRRIQKEGHEIACHGYAHKLIYTQSKEELREDVRKAKTVLEDITGSEVIGYRAPNYSITNKSQWAFEILVEEGFEYDSSIFPIRHDFYGMPNAPRFPFIISLNGNQNVEFLILNYELIKTQNSKLEISNSLTHSLINSRALIEFPLSTVKLLGQNFPISGGGYFRLFPYSLIRRGLKSINQKENKPFIFYVHPWEFDTDQPRIKGAANLSKFRHYVNLDKTEKKFRRLLKDFNFSSVKEIIQLNNSITY